MTDTIDLEATSRGGPLGAGAVAVVTGGGRGIGRALVRSLAEAGASVAILDVDSAAAESMREEIAEAGFPGMAIGCDVSRFEEVATAAQRVRSQLGPVTVLCNNAGIGGGVGPEASEIPMDRWETVLGVNLNGVIHGIRAFVPAMIEAGLHGHVVNTASMAALITAPGTGPYTTSKFAVAGLSEVLRAELASHGIGVSVLCPGPFQTGIWGDDDSSDQGEDPAVLGPLVVAAIERNEAFIFTHPEFAPLVERRFEEILSQLRSAGSAMQLARRN
jgi:NAD(P)-dependent dehydrogenase (short-subunit alcohol dehydrogenase family)